MCLGARLGQRLRRRRARAARACALNLNYIFDPRTAFRRREPLRLAGRGDMTRRSLVVALPALALAPQLRAAPATDPHPAWLEDWRAKRAAVMAMADPDSAEGDVLCAALDDLEAKMIATPAQTLRGAAAQIELLVENEDAGCAYCDRRDGQTLLWIVEQLKARAA